MHLTGDYVNMVDHRGDYIDKPHFLFWITSLSYKIFGVNSFAYRFPSFLFTLLGTYSIYRLGSNLYDKQAGILAALISASSFCYILANSDVRMDAVLTACIAFALWQLVVFIDTKKVSAVLLAGTAMAIGFITKGHVGFVTPAAGAFFYIIYKKEWRMLYHWKWILLILVFAIIIAPVVYCFYLQFDRFPEKVSQGMKGVKGVKYILLTHSFDRISGHERFGTMAKDDRIYFFHTLLWTFAPWSILILCSFFYRMKYLLTRKFELLTIGVFILLALLINFSYFKLPHYLPILAPVASIITAHWLLHRSERARKTVWIIQLVVCIMVLLLGAMINVWAFPVTNILIILIATALLSLLFYTNLTHRFNYLQKSVVVSVLTMVLLFFLLNTNFYPKLLSYQGGKYLAEWSKGKIDVGRVYFMKNTYSSSYNFYTSTIRQVYPDSLRDNEPFYLIYDKASDFALDSMGLNYTPLYEWRDYEISRMKWNFINPTTREKQISSLILAEVK